MNKAVSILWSRTVRPFEEKWCSMKGMRLIVGPNVPLQSKRWGRVPGIIFFPTDYGLFILCTSNLHAPESTWGLFKICIVRPQAQRF